MSLPITRRYLAVAGTAVAVVALVAGMTWFFTRPAHAADARPVKAVQKGWPQDNSDVKPDSAVTWGRLPNGVRYAVMKHAEPPTRVTLRLYVNAGSLMEEEDQRGLAHFLEHMAFNGTTHHPANEMVEYFQRLGMGFGNDTNAHTSWNETVYKLELPNTQDAMMDSGMLMLRDIADGMLLQKKEIEDERGVILAEKRDRDTVNYRMFVDSLKFSLPDSRIATRFTIGDEGVISKAKRDLFLDFYKKWYTPDRMVVIVVGDIDPARAATYVGKYFSDMKPRESQPDPDMGAIKPRGVVAKVLREAEAPSVEISIANIRQLPLAPDTAAERGRALTRDVANAIIQRRLQKLAKQ